MGCPMNFEFQINIVKLPCLQSECLKSRPWKILLSWFSKLEKTFGTPNREGIKPRESSPLQVAIYTSSRNWTSHGPVRSVGQRRPPTATHETRYTAYFQK
jgi:hypothetical protein